MDDRVKVFYQELSRNTCIIGSLDNLKVAIETECSEYCAEADLDYSAFTDERESLIKQISELNPGDEVDAYGFKWGIKEMTKSEIDSLPEFLGW